MPGVEWVVVMVGMDKDYLMGDWLLGWFWGDFLRDFWGAGGFFFG